MRKWITLVEKKFAPGKFADFYRQVVSDGMAYLGMDEDDFPAEDVRDWIAHHRKLFTTGRITAYRALQVPVEFIENLKPNAELGNHWSFNWNMDNVGDFDIHGSRNQPVYVFAAEIETADIVFPLTVAYNCLFPHEEEVFLNSGYARPRIIAIRELVGDKLGEPLRPDLAGTEMRA